MILSLTASHAKSAFCLMELPITKMLESTEIVARCEPRTNMFLMATLYVGANSAPVKVRDMSARGALIEGGTIPPSGKEIRLSRGCLDISGKIVWTTGGRAGLLFHSAIAVTDWLPRGKSAGSQTQVDEFVQLVKSSAGDSTPFPGTAAKITAHRLTAHEITQLQLALESLSEDLAADPAIVERHMEKLQTLDLTAQALTKLAAERGSSPG